MKKQKRITRIDRVRDYLLENGVVTADEMYQKYGIYPIADVITALQKQGFVIEKRRGNPNPAKIKYTLISKPEENVKVEQKPEEFYAIVAFYKSKSGALNVYYDQTLFSSEDEADSYGQIAKKSDPEMMSYDVIQMIKLKKGE